MSSKKEIVAVGLSGGVDSSVVAYLLHNQGYNVIGITMRIWDDSIEIDESAKHACYGPGEEDDVETAEEICNSLGIPLHVIDLEEEYKQNVLDYFKKEYLAGRTPNPCVKCNRTMKFGFMLDRARNNGIEFDLFATGHYARIEKDDNNNYNLKKGIDNSKDQSYFLSGLGQEQLKHTIFPLGGMTKIEVRKIAHEMGLVTADKRESQDFIAGGDYTPLFDKKDFKAGEIVDLDGNVLGEHKGVINYTVGQRRGLGISSPEPLYVLKIDADKNKIVAGKKDKLSSTGLIAGDLNLISIDSIRGPLHIKAKIRQTHKEAEAVLSDEGEGRVKIIFSEPQYSVTPGQTVVFYDNDTVLGGGIIESSL